MKRGPTPRAPAQPVSVANMREAWGADAPEWVAVLAEQCDRTSQKAAARRIGYSPSLVSSVLKRRYTGDLTAVERAVRAALMAETVRCPAFGEAIKLSLCLEHQRHAQSGNRGSAFRAAMARHCPGCPNSRSAPSTGSG